MLEKPNPQAIIIFTILGQIEIILHSIIISHIFNRTKYYIILPSAIAFLVGTYTKLFGFEYADRHIIQIAIVLVLCVLGFSFFIYVNTALNNLYQDQHMTVVKIIQENKLSQIYCDTLHNLDEGIILIDDGKQEFVNQRMQDLFLNLEMSIVDENITQL